MAATAMTRITKTNEAKVAAKMIVLSNCDEGLVLEVGRVVITIELLVNNEFEVDGPELTLVGRVVITIELLGNNEFEVDGPELTLVGRVVITIELLGNNEFEVDGSELTLVVVQFIDSGWSTKKNNDTFQSNAMHCMHGGAN